MNFHLKLLKEKFNEKKSIIETKSFTKDQVIYSHNDHSDYIYLIESGEVKILSKHGLELGILKQGEIFGEVGHIIEKSRSVTAISTTNTSNQNYS